MDGDWLKLHRKISESAVFRSSSLLHLWMYLLVNANYQTRQLDDGTVLQPGQMVRGYRRIAKDLHWGVSKVQRWMRRLIDLGNVKIGTRSGTLAQVVTICNWSTYQQNSQQTDTLSDTLAGTLPGTLPGTKRRREEGEEGNKRASARFVPPTVEEVTAYCQEKGYTFDPEEFVAHYVARNWMLPGKIPMKSWKATCVTWYKNQPLFDQRSAKVKSEPKVFSGPYNS